MGYGKYPKFIRTLKNRAGNYNHAVEEIQRMEREGKIFVIRPETPLEIGRMCHDPEVIQRAYQRGREEALKKMEVLNCWLND